MGKITCPDNSFSAQNPANFLNLSNKSWSKNCQSAEFFPSRFCSSQWIVSCAAELILFGVLTRSELYCLFYPMNIFLSVKIFWRSIILSCTVNLHMIWCPLYSPPPFLNCILTCSLCIPAFCFCNFCGSTISSLGITCFECKDTLPDTNFIITLATLVDLTWSFLSFVQECKHLHIPVHTFWYALFG